MYVLYNKDIFFKCQQIFHFLVQEETQVCVCIKLFLIQKRMVNKHNATIPLIQQPGSKFLFMAALLLRFRQPYYRWSSLIVAEFSEFISFNSFSKLSTV